MNFLKELEKRGITTEEELEKRVRKGTAIAIQKIQRNNEKIKIDSDRIEALRKENEVLLEKIKSAMNF